MLKLIDYRSKAKGLPDLLPYAALIAGFVGLSLTALTTLPLIYRAEKPAIPRDVAEEI